jgi:hypothetical protein
MPIMPYPPAAENIFRLPLKEMRRAAPRRLSTAHPLLSYCRHDEAHGEPLPDKGEGWRKKVRIGPRFSWKSGGKAVG